MSKNETRTYQVLFVFGVIAFLVIATYGIAQIWTFLSVSREKVEIFNEVKDFPDIYTPDIEWLPDEPLERQMEDFNRAAIAKDYGRALYQRNLAVLTKDSVHVADYFTMLSRKKIYDRLNNNKDVLIEQIEVNHNLKLSHYSADGQIVAFKDYQSEHIERVWDKAHKNMIYEKDTSTYQVIMILEDGYWRIHNLKRIEEELPKPKPKNADSDLLRAEKLERLKKAKGINYYSQKDPFKGFWINFDSSETAKDMVLIRKLGFNAIRVFINYEQFGKGNVIPEMIERLDFLMESAEKNNIGVLITLFDFNSDFHLFNFTATDRQLETILTYLKNKKALLAYDLKNEPDIDYKYQDSTLVNQWLQFIVKKAKNYDSGTPLTIGWATADYAHHFSKDLDFVSFHFYKKSKFLESDFEKVKNKIGKKDIVITEYGKSDFQSWIMPIWNSESRILSELSKISKSIRSSKIPNFFWTLYDFEDVSADVAGRWPWQKEPQKHFGLINIDGSLKTEIGGIIIEGKEFKNSRMLQLIPKFMYTYFLIAAFLGMAFYKRSTIIRISRAIKLKLINKFTNVLNK
jgi:hypothetical protein